MGDPLRSRPDECGCIEPLGADATITIDAAKVRELSADFTAANAVLAAASQVTDEDIAREFFGYFDPQPTNPAKLVLR